MTRRSRTARVATRAKAGNGVRRASTGTKAPKPTVLDDDLDGDDGDEDPEDDGDDSDGDEGPEDDGDDSEDSDDGDDSDDTDPETEFLAGLTPEQAKFYSDSTGGLKTKLTKANANARKHRLARAALQAGGSGPAGTQPPKPGPTKKDGPVDQAALLATLKAEMAAEADQKELTRTAAEALVDAGLVLPTDKVARRRALSKAVRMLELDGADVDDVDDEVEALKAEMPGLFKAPRRKPAAGVGGPKKATGSKSTLGGEIDKLFG